MYLKIYIHLPPFAINDRPESSRSPDPQRLSSLITTTLPSPHGSTWFHMVPPFQWRSSHQWGGCLQQLGTSNATAQKHGCVYDFHWFSMTLARKWMVFLSPKYMLARPLQFFLVMSLEKMGCTDWSIGGQLGVIVLAKMRVPASTRSKGGIGRVLLHWLS